MLGTTNGRVTSQILVCSGILKTYIVNVLPKSWPPNRYTLTRPSLWLGHPLPAGGEGNQICYSAACFTAFGLFGCVVQFAYFASIRRPVRGSTPSVSCTMVMHS